MGVVLVPRGAGHQEVDLTSEVAVERLIEVRLHPVAASEVPQTLEAPRLFYEDFRRRATHGTPHLGSGSKPSYKLFPGYGLVDRWSRVKEEPPPSQ